MISNIITELKGSLGVGLFGVALSFFAGTIIFFASIPWLGLSDTSLHLDYSWQVHKGQLPDFYDGAESPMPVNQPPVQFVAQHPPLYHSLLAPFTGPLIDEGKWKQAALAGSLITTLIGLACVFVFSWAGWVYGKDRRRQLAVAVPAVLASMTPFVIVSSMIYNDALALLFSSVGLTLVALIIKKGISKKYLLLVVIVSLLGMSTRAAFISVFMILMLAISISVFVHKNKASIQEKLARSFLYNSLVIIAVVLGIGWFYKRNIQISGSWTQAAPENWPEKILGREYKSYIDVIRSKSFLLLMPTGMYGLPYMGRELLLPHIASIFVFIFSFLVAIWNWLKTRAWKRIDKYEKIIYILLLLHVILILGQQLVHAEGYGGISMRYALPIWVPLGLVIAYSALLFKRTRGQIVVLIAATGWILLFETIFNLIYSRWSSLTDSKHGLGLLQHFSTEVNGLPAFILPSAVFILAIGVALQGYSLWKLTLTKQ